MWKGCFLAVLLCVLSMPVMAAGNYIPKQFSNTSTGDGMYPYSMNNRRNESITQKKNNISGIGSGKPMQSVGKRGVVKRPSPARAATTTKTANTNTRRVVSRSNIARSGTNNNTMRKTYTGNRNVVARSGTRGNNLRSTNVRSTSVRREATNTTTASPVSSQKCFANYKECMEMYCKREDTAYNRCYCSSKLAQIDSKYQSKIDDLAKQIIVLQNTTIKSSTDEEEDFDIVQYWNDNIKQYTGTNPWESIDKALAIEWPDTETRFRGQSAFNTGHQYCVAHLRACSYMASNMRDAYKSEIARDCETYETTLQKIQYAAESVIANYDK